jgi:O-antigen/teichoic acid export membrane protein
MFVGNTTAGVFVYVLQVAMGRMLSVSDYSLFTALFGVFNIAVVPITSILLLVTRKVALEAGAGRLQAAAAVRTQAVRELVLAGSVAILAAILLSKPLAALVGAASVVPVILLWLAVGASMSNALGAAILQGLHRFRTLGIVTAGIPLLRLGLCAGLVAFGFGMGGAMGGLLLSLIVGSAVAWVMVERALPRRASDHSKRALLASREALFLAVNSLAFVALTQIDYIVVRVFCTPDQASFYSAGAVLAKSVLWLPVGIAIALIPAVASHQARSKSSLHLLRQSLGMALLASGVLAVILAVGADFWVSFLYGPHYAPAAVYLRWLSLIYLPIALVLMVDNYFLALKRARFIAIYAGGAALQLAVFLVPGGNPVRLVWALAASSIACGARAAWVVSSAARQHANATDATNRARS